MATTKKTAKKAAKKSGKPAKKSSKTAAKKSKSAKKSIKSVSSGGATFKEVSIAGLIALRNELKPMAQSPSDMTAKQVGDFATRAHTTIETFLMASGGGGGNSDQKIRVAN